MIDEIEKYILDFHRQIQHFNQILCQKFELSSSPSYNEAGRLFPRKGEIVEHEIMMYQYHGTGCTFIKKGIWINYNIDILNNNEVTVTAWDIKKFIETTTNEKTSFTSSEIDAAFLELEKKNILIRRNPEWLVFSIIAK